MTQAIGMWWGGLTEAYKGFAVIAATALATAAVTLSTMQFVGVPARVEDNTAALFVVRDSVQVNARAMEGLRTDASAADLRLERKIDRMLCYMEARENNTSAAGCNR